MLNYKGYTGSIEISVEDGVLHGSVLDIKDVITFEGTTIDEVRQAFQDSVDDYLEFCQEIGQDPDRPFSGKLPFRTSPDVHRLIFIAAKTSGKSINAWMEETLERAASQV
jgi:predicted HicB family RNase H-like nuclease